MYDHKIEDSNKKIRFVTVLSIVGNTVLSAVKVAVGLLTGSIALIADGVHSVSDMATDVAVLLGIHFGSKQADKTHPYGHGRIETFSAGFIALVLVFGGAAMIYYAAFNMTKGEIVQPHIAVLFVAAASVILKEMLYKITKKVAIKTHSSALYANAWHHRSDSFSSIVVLVGFASQKFGFHYGDQVAAVAVGLMIILVGIRIMGDCFRELAESAVDSETLDDIENIIRSNSSIRQWHKLRTRTIGREIFLDLHILVDPQLNITTAHEIAESLEEALHRQINQPVNITVHIEPDVPELRK